jgi:NAD(P)-dependent dehydrogenase (short-subunit alcohol dehydrogenase family)
MKKPQFSLEGKSVLVTGATGGIGRAVVDLMGQAGARLFLQGTSEEKLKTFSQELTAKGVECSYFSGDLTVSETPAQVVRAAISDMGALDVVVNSAGINRPQKALEVTEENWDAVLNINLKALFFVCQAAGKEMLKRGHGSIINISSQAGSVGLPLRAAYCSSKGGVDQLTRTLALEWAPHRVRVNAVAPTFVQTPFTARMFEDEAFKGYVLDSIPMRRMAEPEEVAYAVLFLACDFSEIITGHVLRVDGGWTIK